MPPTQDDLVAMIGSPPTATGIAAAILSVSSPGPTSADPAPDDHGLHPQDPAVTQVPRDETVPTPGVDLPATADSPAPVEASQTSDAAPTADPAPVAEDLDALIASDEQVVAADQAKLDQDEATLAADRAKKGS